MPTTSLYPRGAPLTESMPFTAGDGVRWLAYIEGFPPERGWSTWYRTVLPGRRLRFDSVAESRVSPKVPPGAPFLSEPRLRELLESAQPVPPPAPGGRSLYSPWRRSSVMRVTARVVELSAAAFDDVSRRWRKGADRRLAIRYRVHHTVTGTVDGMLERAGGILPHRTERTTSTR